VFEDPTFISYFRNATPEAELGHLNIGSRPSRRKAGVRRFSMRAGEGPKIVCLRAHAVVCARQTPQTLKTETNQKPTKTPPPKKPSKTHNNQASVATLRAIPWIFAWTQTRLILPSWLGIGEALGAALAAGHKAELRAMYEEWPFFQATMDLIQMILAKCDMRISALYDDMLVCGLVGGVFWGGGGDAVFEGGFLEGTGCDVFVAQKLLASGVEQTPTTTSTPPKT
jgi:phosphoenolpyruvate carboxylase